jgi:hypothetical protein
MTDPRPTRAEAGRAMTDAGGLSAHGVSTIDIGALRKLLAEATPGPWGSECASVFGPDPDRDSVAECDWDQTKPGELEDADAALIAAMRNALPALLDAAEAMQRLQTTIDYCFVEINGIAAEEADDMSPEYWGIEDDGVAEVWTDVFKTLAKAASPASPLPAAPAKETE